MLIPIKQALLEGYNLESIVEAVHANHPNLSKTKTGTSLGYTKPQIQTNRDDLAKSIRHTRKLRDVSRKKQNWESQKDNAEYNRRVGNRMDNEARVQSQMGSTNSDLRTKEQYRAPSALEKMVGKKQSYISDDKVSALLRDKPRAISSAKE